MKPYFIGIDPLTSVSEVQRFLDRRYSAANFNCIDFDEVVRNHVSDNVLTSCLSKVLYKEFPQEEFQSFKELAYQLYDTYIRIGIKAIRQMDLPVRSVIVSSWWDAFKPYDVLGFVAQPRLTVFKGSNYCGCMTVRDHIFLDKVYEDYPFLHCDKQPWTLGNDETADYLDDTIYGTYGIMEDAIAEFNLP